MRALVLSLALFLVGCGGGGGGAGGGGGSGGGVGGNGVSDLSGTTSDLLQSSSDLAATGGGNDGGTSGLCCGQPGDPGNELGVGKYCTGFTECMGSKAAFCANLGGDQKLHFCTMTCTMGGSCGSGATCQCQGGQCGCVPDSCLNMPSTC